jgi:hemerythrin-like domain-containing protein
MLVESTKLLQDILGAATELTINQLGGPLLSRLAPVSDRKRPVITLPGFMAPEASLTPLNQFLNRQGFDARSWGLGRNLGPQDEGWTEHLDRVTLRLARSVRRLADETSAPVSLVGHSLGGIYARELACRFPSEVDRVITLGTPTFHPYGENHHNRLVNTLFGWSRRQNTAEWGGANGILHWDPDRPKLPCVAIHSPIDGFVNEGNCSIPAYIVAQAGRAAPRENVRVLATHLGMIVSPWVLLAIADRLLSERDDWQPFDPSRHLPRALGHLVRVMYPTPGGTRRVRRDAKSGRRTPRSKVVERLIAEHRYLDGLMRLLERRSRHRRYFRSADYYLLRDIVGYAQDYAERVHHPAEDLLARKLLLRRPAAKDLVERLQREHAHVSAETRRLLAQIDALIRKPGDERAGALREACGTFAARQRAHIRFEDDEIFPCGIESLTGADWRAIEARLFAAEDPLFGRTVSTRHRVLYEYLVANEMSLRRTPA